MRMQWKMRGFKEVRTSDEVEALLRKVIDEMLDDLGEGYEGDVQTGRSRSRGGVVTASREAREDNARNNTLLRALAAARRDG